MDLRVYLRILRKRVWLVIVATVLCPSFAFVASQATTPIYQGTAKLIIIAKADPSGGTSSAYEGALLSQQLVKSFAQILLSRATAEAALRVDPQPLTPSQLQSKVHAEPVADTLLINLSVEDPNAARARRLTNNIAWAFIQTVPNLQGGSTLRVSLVEPALTPTEPVRPRTRLNTALGLLLGLLIGVALASLREFLDRSLKTPEELEVAIAAPVIGAIPPFRANRQPIPVAKDPRSAVAEAFRKLRTNFTFLGVDRTNVCCVVTSPSSGDGKSTVAANLAIALAQAGQRVALIDADLRKPAAHKLFNLNQWVGTTTVLLDQVSVQDALQDLGPGMPAVLTAGRIPPNPSELLGSRRMQELLSNVRADYEVTIVDCAPLLPVTDPMVVSQFADGVLLIARARQTTRDHASAAAATCVKAGATVFGSILNATPKTEGGQSAYYAYYGEIEDRSHTLSNPELAADPVKTNGSRHPRGGRAARHRRDRPGIR